MTRAYAGGSKTFNERTGRHERKDGIPMRRKNRQMAKKKQRMAGERFRGNGNGNPVKPTSSPSRPDPKPGPGTSPRRGMPPRRPDPKPGPGTRDRAPMSRGPYDRPARGDGSKGRLRKRNVRQYRSS